MTYLMQLQNDIQAFAEAFSAALKVNVEVFDQYRRIAGTGAAKNLIGEMLLPQGIVAQRIYHDGLKRFIFEDPGQNPLCKPCPRRNACHYRKAVHSSLQFEGQVIGIIGIVAEREEQVRLIEYNNYAMLELVDRIAELITSKVRERRNLIQVKKIADLLRGVTNTIDKGIFVLDPSLHFVEINDYLLKRLQREKVSILNHPVAELFPSLDFHESCYAPDAPHQDVSYTAGTRQIYLRCSMKAIRFENELEWIVCFVDDYKEATRMAYAITDKQRAIHLDDVVGEDSRFLDFKDKVRRIAGYESTVLLTGETGTGKELFVRAIHAESSRSAYPFVAINCASIPESLLESELFGYEKGAFTGASPSGKHGKFFLANRGTLFLDELEVLPLYLQPKLLRAIERQEIERVGGTKPIPIDVRIIAATNVRLDEMVKKGEFRDDLFYRLNVVSLFVPALRERGKDVLVLAEYFIDKFSRRFGKHIEGLSTSVMELFLKYPWPGNVRELQNAIEYAINMETSSVITYENLPLQLREFSEDNVITGLRDLEREEIRKALDLFGWTEEGKNQAARHVGISRSTIYRRIRQYGLKP